ncbi:MAG: site-specific integrase [Acidobacteriaceae bacterium]|nr:site-specific integrase [Acidobacteriaceae bacterium]
MSLFKRGNVYWAYLYRDGVRHQYSTGTSNRKQAEKIEDKLKQDLNDSRFQLVEFDPDITFGAIAARFVASGSARPHHLYHLRFVLSFFSDVPALRLTKALAEEFRRRRRTNNPAIKDATVNRDLSVLRHILYWAVDEQLIAANPLARLKMAPERRIRRQILSIAEEARLFSAAQGHLRAMILIALDTGMRRGEITSERWEDIDFSQKILSVTRSKTPGGESREIPLTGRLYAYLSERHKPEGLVIVFHGQAVRIVKRAWKTALKNAGIRHVRFHDLRHTFNTRLMEAGVLQEVRMALMGHSIGSKIHSLYTHIELPTKREAIRRLEAWVNDQEQHLKENQHANAETTRYESNPGREAGAQTMEEEKPRRSGLGTSRQAEGRNRRDGAGSQSEAQAIAEVRGGEEAFRSDLAGSGRNAPKTPPRVSRRKLTDVVPAPDG